LGTQQLENALIVFRCQTIFYPIIFSSSPSGGFSDHLPIIFQMDSDMAKPPDRRQGHGQAASPFQVQSIMASG
jgi:hypothetical protein